MPDRPPTSSRSSAKPSRYSPCRVQKRSNNCVSEKQLVRASGQTLSSPDTGAHGASAGSGRHSYRLKYRFALTHQLFFSGRSWDHINIRSQPAWETVSVIFERELDRNAPISVRVIATSGITHGRKTVSPSRNPCDSDPFLVATHNRCSPSWDPHRLFFFGPELKRNRINWDRSPVPVFLSTAEHRLAADRSNQIFLHARSRMKRHLRC